MTLEAPEADAAFQQHLADKPDVLDELSAAHAAAVDAIPARLYDLTRLRVAMLLGADDELEHSALSADETATLAQWPTSPHFDDQDRAILAFVEQWVIDVANVSDDQANAVVQHLGGDDFATFVHALLVVEQRQRLRLGWQQLFGGTT